MALFSLIGTTYGGNGVTTFALPDLRGRTAISAGQSVGGPLYTWGQKAGAESATLAANHMASHVHTGPATFHMEADNVDGTITRAIKNYPASSAGSYAAVANAVMAAPVYTGSIGTSAGGTTAINTRTPYLTIGYIICVSGVFPAP
jgi:microcystin-dependent protein